MLRATSRILTLIHGTIFEDVTRQIFGSLDTSQPATMNGFIQDYALVSKDPIRGENIMRCFKPETLPILSTLAMQYGVCDRWFSSVPGSTIPNRMFVHGASSAEPASQDAVVAPFLLKTIFESFGPNTPHTYKIYTSGASILMANKYLVQHRLSLPTTTPSLRRMHSTAISRHTPSSNRSTTTMTTETLPAASTPIFPLTAANGSSPRCTTS